MLHFQPYGPPSFRRRRRRFLSLHSLPPFSMHLLLGSNANVPTTMVLSMFGFHFYGLDTHLLVFALSYYFFFFSSVSYSLVPHTIWKPNKI